MPARLTQIDPTSYSKLRPDDKCWYIGEYTSGGGFGCSETNQQILNLKKLPGCSARELYWKRQAVDYWAARLRERLDLAAMIGNVTLVPAPCSKPPSNPRHDDRMTSVLAKLAGPGSGLDIRQLLVPIADRPAQHEGSRLTIEEIQAVMGISREAVERGLVHPTVVVVDDVFTRGGTFAAMRNHLLTVPGVRQVCGIFLAKTVWPNDDID